MSSLPESSATTQTQSGSVPTATYRAVAVQRRDGNASNPATDWVAEEQPVQLLYQNVPHVVMLASPADLEDLAVGFTISEGIVADTSEIHAVEVTTRDAALAVNLHITGERFSALLRRQRNLTGRTGCGLCGVQNLDDAIRHPDHVHSDWSLSRAELDASLASLQDLQPLNALTGSVHAAAWALPGKGIQLVREDVGRHNALDKVIGALLRAGIDASTGYCIITSRASYEMVQKAATAGISLIAAVSAPTALAIDIADQTGVTLVGFARDDRHVVYAHPQRLSD